MQRFTALDLQRNVGPVQEAALREPIAITHHGRDRLVVMSAAEFDRLKRRDKQVIAIQEMPEAFIAALSVPADDPELAALDYLLEE